MRQRLENSGTFLNEATRILILFVALQFGKARICCLGESAMGGMGRYGIPDLRMNHSHNGYTTLRVTWDR